MMKQTIIELDDVRNITTYVSDDDFIIDIELNLENLNDCLISLYKKYTVVTCGPIMYKLYRVNFDFYINKGNEVNMKAYYEPLLGEDLIRDIIDTMNKHI